MRTPRITVAIPFKNAAGTLHYAIESVLRQTFTDFELLLVNDGSSDSSLAVAGAYLNEPRVRLFHDTRNLGLAERLNQITHAASAPLLARMDADDLMHPNRLELQACYLDANPAVDLIGTGIWLIDSRYRILGRKATPLARPCERMQFVQFFHPTVTGNREWFLRNPYSSRFSRSEDVELWYRTARDSVFAHLSEPLFFHLPSFVVDTRKTATSLRQYRDILRLYQDRICQPCRYRLLAGTYVKSAAFHTLGKIGLSAKAVSAFGSQAGAPGEVAEAACILKSIREAAEERVAARRYFASAPTRLDRFPARLDKPLVYQVDGGYGSCAPFHPPLEWPELKRLGCRSSGDNPLYKAVRGLFSRLALDTAHAGGEEWNPLGRWIRPGMRVVIKPNWVKHEFGETVGRNAVCTHASLLRVLIDYALIASGKDGAVAVADSPLLGADFPRYRRQSGIDILEEHYRALGAPVRFLDLRLDWAEIDDHSSYIKKRHRLHGDPEGYAIVDLAENSRLVPFGEGSRFGVTDYRADNTSNHHGGGRHRYCISRTVLSADVLINVPKLKTHLKTGMTGALKNLIGINCSKDYLPHYRLGDPVRGGDEYPDGSPFSRAGTLLRARLQERGPQWIWNAARRLSRRINRGALDAKPLLVQGGGWHGNDTLWRTVHDIVTIAREIDPDGSRRAVPRPMLTFVDAITCGEGAGPLTPVPKDCGVIVFGEEPGPIDIVCAMMMGFDWRRIPMLRAVAPDAREIPFDASSEGLRDFVLSGSARFQAPPGWVGAIEREERAVA
jgi:uncharacterized protein (DUF362 family)/glycosyltransferase involved in cell wall biosynthesis